VVGAMHEASFFHKQIDRCNVLAGEALSQGERRFWLQAAQRWEAMLQVNHPRRAVPKPSDLSVELPSTLASTDDQDVAALS
jgi:hypothetical protein